MTDHTAPDAPPATFEVALSDVTILDGAAILTAAASLPACELPLAHLPAEVEAELAHVSRRLERELSESLGMAVEIDAVARIDAPVVKCPCHGTRELPLADDPVCGPATCAGPCSPANGQHTAYRGEPLFTMAEALQEIAERTCAVEGHDLDIISDYVPSEPTPRPIAIVCGRPCQFRGYRVVPIGEPDVAALLTAALLDLWADLGAAYDRSPADPRESSIECVGLITRIVDITRTLGTVPAEIVPPELVTSGVYVEVHRLAGHVATVAPCTAASAVEAVQARDAARGDRPPAPCERLSREQPHPAHDWHAPVDGAVRCPGWSAG